MVFAHRLDCDQTTDGLSIFWKLPLMILTAVLKNGVIFASNNHYQQWEGEWESLLKEEKKHSNTFDDQDGFDFDFYHPHLPPVQRIRSCSFNSSCSGRWEPSLPTIDEEENPSTSKTKKMHQRMIVDGPVPNLRYNLCYEEESLPPPSSSSPDLSATVISMGLWLPAILWSVSFLWFCIEQTKAMVVGGTSSWGIR